MGVFDGHDIQDGNRPAGKDIKKGCIGMGDVHPAVAILEDLNVGSGVRIFEFQQVLFDKPPVFCRKIVNVPECLSIDGYPHVMPPS